MSENPLDCFDGMEVLLFWEGRVFTAVTVVALNVMLKKETTSLV